MLKRLSDREILAQLADTWEAALREAWVASINDITASVTLKNVIAEIERGNVDGALRLLNIDADRFGRFERAILNAWDAGGIATVDRMPRLMDPQGNRVVFSWGVRNVPAEQAIRNHAASLVTGIVQDTRAGIREILADGLARGQNPRQTALGLVGRINRRTGLREGGLIGLTQQQMRTVSWIEQALRDGDAEKLRQYLGLKLRDRRFDRTILKALREGELVPASTASRIVQQYSNRALKYRGDVLSRHETLLALARAQDDAFAQQIASGKIDQRDLTKTWKHQAGQEHPRMQHIAMNGQTVGFNEAFVAPDGTRLRFPLDPDAPASHTLNCKCRVEYDIDHVGGFLRSYREGRIG